MHITKIKIKNFKRYYDWFTLDLNPGINILVGQNEIGKSTIIEAINLALSGFYHGKYVRNDISQYLFNQKAVEEYLKSIAEKSPIEPPSVIIEIYFDECVQMRGNHNDDVVEADGLYFKICFDDKYKTEYNELLTRDILATLPIEYYHVVWRSFHREDITSRSIPFKSALIDTSAQYQSASDIYVTHIIKNKLDDADKIAISQTYRRAQQLFINDDAVSEINKKLSDLANIDNQNIALSVDLSSCRAWEDVITAYMNNIPFHFIGKGRQCIIKTKLALAKSKDADKSLILIEEPENHLAFGKLNQLINSIKADGDKQQIIISTHSSFVLNKLGLSNLILLSNKRIGKLTDLSPDTLAYFEKLAGYDTLRMLLCSKAILVEGDSDELVVQKAYLMKYHCLPIENNVDVISVRGLAFLRFLEIADNLQLNVSVVTDNDGKPEKLREKYAKYIDESSTVKIYFDDMVDCAESFDCQDGDLPADFNFNTLEPKMLKANSIETFMKIFGSEYDTSAKMLRHLHSTKGLSGLAIFHTTEDINFPQYILDAIDE